MRQTTFKRIQKAMLRKKSLTLFSDNSSNSQELHRTLNLLDIILYGIGCSVGAGIYSLVGIGARIAGPAISISFLICGVACIFTSLTYAELAGRIPVAGSAYAFTYVAFGELAAWLVGWNMTLGYGISSAVVARSWAEYLVSFTNQVSHSDNIKRVMNWLVAAPIPFIAKEDYTCSPLSIVIIGLCTVILVSGSKESTSFNNLITIINLSMLGLVVILGLGSGSVEVENLQPFVPNGVSGIAQGSGFVFFAYLGFDMVSCLSEEVKDPQKNMPKGIVGSLIASMFIYITVALVVVGMAPIDILGSDVPIINALLANACCTHSEQTMQSATFSVNDTCLDTKACFPIHNKFLFYGSHIVSFGAMFGLTTSTFTGLMGQPRIFYSMARDGLLFEIFGQVNEQTGVPLAGTLITSSFVAVTACFMDLEALANIISIGTLQVFSFVCAGVLILRTDDHVKNMTTNNPSVSFDSKTSWTHRNEVILLIIICAFSSLFFSLSITQNWHNALSIASFIMLLYGSVLLHMVPMASLTESFSCPAVPTIPLLGIITNSYMIGSMPMSSWFGVSLWLLCGFIVYFSYGIWNSRLSKSVASSVQEDNIEIKPLTQKSSTSSLSPEQNRQTKYGTDLLQTL
eukprot:CAMPEP_0197829504 /NCGR_PEP_ID=MMETSP1437-20131217/5988_1 /TAXON_ID=49252 ORGANISM="Eucampia antarctica, Strain CCMP1452" /NCGR_SAMPLE_ID=MMETSP1437 /ASSEMBLY_ACC=CAM_ASM_001096 /LENGTH=628 /DNA_ID=CAMNT_0043431239 /DNA_START=15 /DNA_END=1901 /DNA_ORIENTATION=-